MTAHVSQQTISHLKNNLKTLVEDFRQTFEVIDIWPYFAEANRKTKGRRLAEIISC
jgi:hypothetical protein